MRGWSPSCERHTRATGPSPGERPGPPERVILCDWEWRIAGGDPSDQVNRGGTATNGPPHGPRRDPLSSATVTPAARSLDRATRSLQPVTVGCRGDSASTGRAPSTGSGLGSAVRSRRRPRRRLWLSIRPSARRRTRARLRCWSRSKATVGAVVAEWMTSDESACRASTRELYANGIAKIGPLLGTASSRTCCRRISSRCRAPSSSRASAARA